MTALPPSGDFTNSATTEGGFKTALTNLRAYLSSILGDDGTLTTAMQTLGSLFNSTSSKSTNYTVIDTDRGKTIQCTATLELALTAAATLGSSFAFTVDNIGSGTVTINPNGTELIDGLSTITLTAGQSCLVYCNGSAFYTVGLAGASYSGKTRVIFSSSGSWTPPDGINKAVITVVGGGGGSGGGGNGGNFGFDGGGGGCIQVQCTGLTGSYTITIGAGGAGSSGGGNPSQGSAGTSSSITGTNVSITATGGGGGNVSARGASGVGSQTGGTTLRQTSGGILVGAGGNPTTSNGAGGTSVTYTTSNIFSNLFANATGSVNAAVAWTVSSNLAPGSFGHTTNGGVGSAGSGGVSGCIMIEY